MNIVSLLPSATEIVFQLGLGDQLRAVTFECDYPVAARGLPQVSRTSLPDGELSPAEIDAEVTSRVETGEPLYTLDAELIRRIDPDLILTQDLCRVCAVPAGAVDQALETIGCHAAVVSLDPHRLDEVISCVGDVGAATGTEAPAAELMTDLRGRVTRVQDRVRNEPQPRVLVLEWGDPPFNAGHWVPDMVEAAGATSVLAAAGESSRRLTWDEIATAGAEIIVFMPCGFNLDAAVEQAGPVLARPELDSVSTFYAVDGNAFFSRPGPRLVDGVEMLAELFHPSEASLMPPGAARLR